MKLNKLFWIVFLGMVFHCNAQEDLFKYYESLWNSKSVSTSDLEKKVDSILFISEKRGQNLQSIKIAHEFSRKLYTEDLYKKGIGYIEFEISIYRKLGVKNSKYVKALYNLGLFYALIENYEESRISYQEVIAINADKYTTAKAFCELGKYYYKKGDFFKANDYYSQGVTRLEGFNRKKLLIKKYIDYSHVLFEIGTQSSLDRMLEVLDKANNLFSVVSNYSLNDFRTLNNDYVNYYNTEERFDFEKAKYYCNRNLNKAIQDRDSTFIYASYTNLGRLHLDTKNEMEKDSALFFLNSGLRYARNTTEKSIVHHQLSHYYLENENFKLALSSIQNSLIEGARMKEDINALPNFKNIKISNNQYNILLALIQKATVLIKLHNQSSDMNYAEIALSNLLSADQLVDSLLDVSKEEGSRLYWRDKASEIYVKGILVCDILNEKEQAFYFSEKKKALLLTQDILKNTNKSSLPKNILVEENRLKKQILDLENRIAKNQKNKDSVRFLELNRFELKREYQKQQDSLSATYKEYYKNIETTRIANLYEIQETLDTETVVISYVSNYDKHDDAFSKLYAVLFTKTQIEIIEIGNIDLIEGLIKTYRSQLSKPFETKIDQSLYNDTASKLYSLLIPEDKISIRLDHKKLVVIPDEPLQYIPFEALIVDKKSNRYLIENNEISYAYSMSFLQYNAKLTRTTAQNIAAFAPITFTHDNLEDISNSINELNAIQGYDNLTIYKNKEASKQNFLSKSTTHKIIHLATHANFSNDLQIAFHESNLGYHELYTFKNQAELVVLSACNTSLGKIAKGEGVMSLARGFFYSGANTVISSLWNANDKSTAQIMQSFYYNLANGQTKSKALHSAKIEYLKSNSLSDASPHYWATFVLIGDAETKLFSSNTLFNYIVFSLFFILLIRMLFVFYKKR